MKIFTVFVGFILWAPPALSASVPAQASNGMVVCQNAVASRIGVETLENGGNAVDAAIATAFALAVVHPSAGNIGGGGFLVFLSSEGDVTTYDFREKAPKLSSSEMWVANGKYDADRHHNSYLSVGVPGTVAGLHLAWVENGSLSWSELVRPAIKLAEKGVIVTHSLADSLALTLPRMQPYPGSMAQFTKNGKPFSPGDTLIQTDLARSLRDIANDGPAGFYEGRIASLLHSDMKENGGILTQADLREYSAIVRPPVRSTYRGFEIISMGLPSSGGICLVEMLNVLEGYDIRELGFGSAATFHLYAESMRLAFRDRAQFLGDSDFVPTIPTSRLTSKEYAIALQSRINEDRASSSILPSPSTQIGRESEETTHISVVDSDRNAVSLTYTLEQAYGSGIVSPGTGFLLNNEMGDFNPMRGLTTKDGSIGTTPNLVAPEKRMLSSMTPTIVRKGESLFGVFGSPGGRTIINTVLQLIVNAVDFDMNAQEAVDAARIHHQWWPDRIVYERLIVSPDTISILERMGHETIARTRQGAAEIILINEETGRLEAGSDGRVSDGGAAGH